MVLLAALAIGLNAAPACCTDILTRSQFEKILYVYVEGGESLRAGSPEVSKDPYETMEEYQKRKDRAIRKHEKDLNRKLKQYYKKNRQTLIVSFPVMDVKYTSDDGRFSAYIYRSQNYDSLPLVPSQLKMEDSRFFSLISDAKNRLRGGIYGTMKRGKAKKYDIINKKGELVCTFNLYSRDNRPVMKLKSVRWTIEDKKIWSW
jgi:hypothetical protein